VTTGITGESDIQILEGVQPGMEIITGPSRVLKTLKDDMAVKRLVRKPGDNSNANEK
jgi:HlyD family secretion protein